MTANQCAAANRRPARHSATTHILIGRGFFSAVLLMGFICACLGDPSQQPPPISEKERFEIEAVIKKETKEKILRIRRESQDGVEVTTGVITPGRLEGKGQTFWLKRTKKGWEVQKRGLWVS